MPTKEWFTVDKEGLREIYAHHKPHQLMYDLVQNAFDTDSRVCEMRIQQDTDCTRVEIEDEDPQGFLDLGDSYTMFKSASGKRGDCQKRGRFSSGEKIVLARARTAKIVSTTGTVIFDDKGRRQTATKTEAGTRVSIEFPKWEQQEYDEALKMLSGLYTPAGIVYTLNGDVIPHRDPKKVVTTNLTTEISKEVEGQAVMSRTRRNTELHFYDKHHDSAYLCEMGLPVCEIDGGYDVDVQQKVPLGQDRTMVPQSYLQDIYAELLMALGDEIEPEDLGSSHVRSAMEDDRMDAETCKKMFVKSFGEAAVLQNPFDNDSNQEAARAGAALVSPRTFGKSVNDKLREAGVQTTTEKFCRNRDMMEGHSLGAMMPQGFREVKEPTPRQSKLAEYVNMLSEALYGRKVDVEFAQWLGTTTAAMYQSGKITFNIMRVPKAEMDKPVSCCTSLVLHELAHSCGADGHSSVYDHEYERLVNRHTRLMARQPALYQAFEPELFED